MRGERVEAPDNRISGSPQAMRASQVQTTISALHEATGRPLAIRKSSKASPGVSRSAISTSGRSDSAGLARKAWMITSRRPRSEWKVLSYASWHASGNSGLLRCRSTWLANLLRERAFRPAMPYLRADLVSKRFLHCSLDSKRSCNWREQGTR